MTPADAPPRGPALRGGRLLVATTNPNKLREIRPLLSGLAIELVTLAECAGVPEPEEAGATFWENARLKALAYAGASGLVTVAEDSGFEVDALDGEPGVQSARFLRRDASYDERFAEIYRRLGTATGGGPHGPLAARFRTALAVARGRDLLFETETSIEGLVAPSPRGRHGFGYDPIFWYPPYHRTTAELTDQEKAIVSHRARAFRDLHRWLSSAA